MERTTSNKPKSMGFEEPYRNQGLQLSTSKEAVLIMIMLRTQLTKIARLLSMVVPVVDMQEISKKALTIYSISRR